MGVMTRLLFRTALFCLAGCFSLLFWLTSVSAQEDDDERGDVFSGNSEIDDTNSLVLGAAIEWLPVGSEGGSDSSCGVSSVTVAVSDDFSQPVTGSSGETIEGQFSEAGSSPSVWPLLGQVRLFSPTGRWFQAVCDGTFQVVPEGGPSISVDGLLLEALRRLDPPGPVLITAPPEAFYTQIQTWLSIDPVYWDQDRTATASAGRVSVTGTLTPSRSVWDMGDGNVVECSSGGIVWEKGMEVQEPTECGYFYRTSSSGERGSTYHVTSEVVFEVGLTTNAPGTYGPYADVVRTTEFDVEVREIQALSSANPDS